MRQPARLARRRRERHRIGFPRSILICTALAVASTLAANPQGVIERPVTIYVAGTAGGGTDLYPRPVGRHIPRPIPGTPPPPPSRIPRPPATPSPPLSPT